MAELADTGMSGGKDPVAYLVHTVAQWLTVKEIPLETVIFEAGSIVREPLFLISGTVRMQQPSCMSADHVSDLQTPFHRTSTLRSQFNAGNNSAND